MIFFKRLGATVIDFIIFISVTFIFSWVLKKIDIDEGQSNISMSLAFLSCIIFPIILFTKTLGQNLLKVEYKNLNENNLKVKILTKYITLYLLFALYFSNLLGFAGKLLEVYTYLPYPEFFTFRVNIVLVFTNAICFLLTFGRENLLDRIFGIHYKLPLSAKKITYPFLSIYIFNILMLLSFCLETKIRDIFDFNYTLKKVEFLYDDVKFPVEIFDNYTSNGQISYGVDQTNLAITNSDELSYFTNRLEYQRHIVVYVKKSLLFDSKKRAELCSKLIEHCQIMVDLQDLNDKVVQTKITLINMDYYIPYIAVVSHYTYYFDDKINKFGLYGGFNSDTLNSCYYNTQQKFLDSCSKFLGIRTGVSAKIILSYFRNGTFSNFLQNLPDSIQKSYADINLTPLVDKRLWRLNPIPFDSTKRKRFLSIGYPMAFVNDAQLTDDMLVSAMLIRNHLIGIIK